MAYEIKDNTFSLFENDKKGNEKAPDYKGKGLIDGKEVRVAIWKRTSKSGIEYLSGSIDRSEKPAAAEPQPEPQPEAVNDDIPF